jgi:hypothetical protein
MILGSWLWAAVYFSRTERYERYLMCGVCKLNDVALGLY